MSRAGSASMLIAAGAADAAAPAEAAEAAMVQVRTRLSTDWCEQEATVKGGPAGEPGGGGTGQCTGRGLAASRAATGERGLGPPRNRRRVAPGWCSSAASGRGAESDEE
jgi:hypothetical protein